MYVDTGHSELENAQKMIAHLEAVISRLIKDRSIGRREANNANGGELQSSAQTNVFLGEGARSYKDH